MENQLSVQLYSKLIIRVWSNYQIITNSMHVQKKTSTITSPVKWLKINSWILNTYVPTDKNIVDIFTKALARLLFKKFRGMLGLHYVCLRGSVEIRASLHLFYEYFHIISFTFLLYPTTDSALVSYFCFILLLWSHLLTWSWDICGISNHTLLIQTNILLVYLV